MSQPNRQDSYNEKFALYFEGELVGEADIMYRYCFAQTLDEQAAFECVQKLYKGMVKKLPELVQLSSQDVRKRLFKECHKLVEGGFQAKPKTPSALASFLQPFNAIERASLVMVELGGVYPGECAEILESPEKDIRIALAKTRESIVSFAS